MVRSGLPTRMVGLDVTRQMTLTAAEVATLTKSRHQLVRWLAMAMQFRGDPCTINDILTVAEIVTPGLLGFEAKGIRIELDESQHRGLTIEGAAEQILVATSVDITRIRQLLARVFGRDWWQPYSQKGLA